MLDVKIALVDIPEWMYALCEAHTPDARDTLNACLRTWARDCIAATLVSIDDDPIFKAAWRYSVLVENGLIPAQWHEIISAEPRATGWRERADAAFDRFVAEELT